MFIFSKIDIQTISRILAPLVVVFAAIGIFLKRKKFYKMSFKKTILYSAIGFICAIVLVLSFMLINIFSVLKF
jgi:hypothetical protein